MDTFPIALQLYSLRDDMTQDFEGTLRRVKKMGYDGVEFAGLFGRAPARIKDLCAELDLTPLSAHVPFVEMMAAAERVLADYAAIGCRYVAIPYLTEEYRPGAARYGEVLRGARILGELAGRMGMTLLYHNHDFEFQKMDGQYALDQLYEALPATLLQTQLDTCWVNVGGEDPAAYIRRYAGRAPVVHLKDFVMPGKKPAHPYQLIGLEDSSSAEDVAGFEYRPLGQGVQDIPAILDACRDADTQWVVVEQDDPTPGTTPIDCAKASLEYLRSLD